LRRNVTERAICAQFQGSVHRPVWDYEDFAANSDQIGVAISQDLLGLVAWMISPNRHGHDLGVAADMVRQRHL